MTGLCGALALDRPGDAAQPDIAAMVTALGRWGGAEVAVHRGRGLALAQDLQPQVPEAVGLRACVAWPERELVIAADLRLDNRDELIETLGLGADARGWPDEALVLRAHARWGGACVERLLGDFCYALWDGQHRELHLARDPMGVRPLYYCPRDGAGMFAFASSLPVLLARSSIPRGLDEARLAEFFVLHDDLHRTFYRDIVRLPPGTRARIRDGVVQSERYHRIELPARLELADARDYADRFRELLVQATACRLRSPVGPGLLLSGGLDSSTLAGIVREHGGLAPGTALRTFSGTFPDYPGIDERDWIQKVLDLGGCEPRFHRMDRERPLGRLDRDLALHGQPFYAPNNYVDSALMDLAARSGVELMLDGLDGDSTVGHGWEFLGQLLREGRWRRMLREARALARQTDRSAGWFLWRHAVGPTLVGLGDRVRGESGVRVPAVLSPAFAERVGLHDTLVQRRREARSTPLSPYRVQHWDKVASSVLPMSYEIAAQQARVRGIVRRHPYYDRRLVEFCLSLPPEQRLARGADRMVQRRAVRGLAPEEIRRRLTKSNWEQNFRDRIVTEDRDELVQFRTRYGPALGPFLNVDHVERRIDVVLGGQGRQADLARVWMAVAVGKWLLRTYGGGSVLPEKGAVGPGV